MSLASRSACLILAAALTGSLPHCAVAQAGDTPAAMPEKHDLHSVESDLIAEKFDELDSLAAKYRQDKSRGKGGEWRLRKFYEALDAPQLTDKDSMEHIAHLEHWTQARPNSITARVALATSLSRWAWVARGNGMANTVTAEGWRLFGERMGRAQTVLQDAAGLQPMCPQWYSVMMAVGLAQNWDNAHMKETFERGIQFEPGYYYLYKQYANYLLPKWDGNPGDASSFAKRSADNLGGDNGDMLYFQVASVLIKPGDGNFPVHEMNWERIQRGYDLLARQYGDDNRSQNQLAFMAFKYRDAGVASREFALIGDEWSHQVWKNRLLFDRARDWSHSAHHGE